MFNRVLNRRAEALTARVGPFIEVGSKVLDIGCGTGHNAATIRERRGCSVTQVDVVDMSVLGPPPTIFDGRALSFCDQAFDAGLMLFVLHYCSDPEALLGEARRVIRRRLLVVQSTYRSPVDLALLRAREWAQGRMAFRLARAAGLIKPCGCALTPVQFMTREKLEGLFRRTGWNVGRLQAAYWPMTGLSRDLYVLE